MGALTAVHEEIRALLVAAGLDADYAPRPPVDGQGVAIWPTPGIENYTRQAGGPHARVDRVQLTCAGPTILDTLACASKVRAALAGKRLTAAGANGGTLTETGWEGTQPAVESDAAPVRYSLPIWFQIITKGLR